MFGIIYKATNILTLKCYIGQTIQPLSERRSSHLSGAKWKQETYFHRSLLKYGWIHFEWEELCECDFQEELDEMEYHFIQQYHSYVEEWGYNLSYNGKGGGDTRIYKRDFTGKVSGRVSILESDPDTYKRMKSLRRKRKGRKQRSYKVISEILNQEGCSTTTGKQFTSHNVRRILQTKYKE